MDLKPFYSYDVIARLERRSKETVVGWITADRKLPEDQRRFPGAFGGQVPLADVKARYGLTNEDVKALDLPEPEQPRPHAPRKSPRPAAAT